MPSPKHALGSLPTLGDFAEKMSRQNDDDLKSEIRELRQEVAELKALLSPPSSIILTGDAVTRFMLSRKGDDHDN